MFLEVESLDEIKKELDKYCMVMIFRALHRNFDHIRDQLLTCYEVPSMITRLLRVLMLQN